MLGVTYGPVNLADMVWLMPVNQLFNLADVAGGGLQYNEYSTPTAMGGTLDVESTHRMKSYGGVPIVIVPDMTNTEILLLNRTKIKVYNWMALEITPKDIAAAEQSWLLKFGANVVCTDPRQQGKLPLITA
jgi:hypothetical protein